MSNYISEDGLAGSGTLDLTGWNYDSNSFRDPSDVAMPENASWENFDIFPSPLSSFTHTSIPENYNFQPFSSTTRHTDSMSDVSQYQELDSDAFGLPHETCTALYLDTFSTVSEVHFNYSEAELYRERTLPFETVRPTDTLSNIASLPSIDPSLEAVDSDFPDCSLSLSSQQRQTSPTPESTRLQPLPATVRRSSNLERVPCDFPGCVVTISRRYDMRRHYLAAHASEKVLYHCPVAECPRKDGFKREDKLKKHMREVHGARPNRKVSRDRSKVGDIS